jgi:uncharacterized protein (TIGR02646 family)
MRQIQKQKAPEEFNSWKRSFIERKGRAAKFRELTESIKQVLKKALLREQKGLCCYCCNRIVEDNSHIEHFIPQEVAPTKVLDYSNLHASCSGYIEDISTVDRESCGHRKDNWYDKNLCVSPLDSLCEKIFEYTYDGRIKPHEDDPRAQMMIEKLGLDTYSLQRAREIAIDFSGIFEETYIDQDKKEELLSFYNTPDQEGKLLPFCNAIINLLKSI